MVIAGIFIGRHFLMRLGAGYCSSLLHRILQRGGEVGIGDLEITVFGDSFAVPHPAANDVAERLSVNECKLTNIFSDRLGPR